MHLHAIQHVEFEGPGLLADWAEERGHILTSSLASSKEFPVCQSVDFLVLLGGPMDADDENASPWLHAEKHFVADCITSGRVVLGVCLGAQIIAEVLGGNGLAQPGQGDRLVSDHQGRVRRRHTALRRVARHPRRGPLARRYLQPADRAAACLLK